MNGKYIDICVCVYIYTCYSKPAQRLRFRWHPMVPASRQTSEKSLAAWLNLRRSWRNLESIGFVGTYIMLLYCGFGSSSSAGSSSGEDLVVEGFAPLGAEGVGVEGLRGLGVTGGAVGDGLVSPPFKASNLCLAA